MEIDDVTRLFDLLDKLYQGKPRPRDRVTAAVWREVLRPWTYPQVRDAVIKRARTNRYYPDPSEIAELCPPAPEAAESEDRIKPPGPSEMRYLRWAQAYRRKLTEALGGEERLTLSAQRALLEERGVDTVALLEDAWLETRLI